MRAASIQMLMLISLSLVGAFIIPPRPNAPSFAFWVTRQYPGKYGLTACLPTVTSLASALAEPEDGTLSDVEPTPTANVELWLDLRRTAIRPHAALSHLSDELCADYTLPPGKKHVVDRVLVSEDGAVHALQHMTNGNNPDQDFPAVFYVKDDDGTIRNVRDDATVVGSVISLENDALADPIPALGTMSKGGWVVVDSDAIEDLDRRGDAVVALVDFLSVGASATPSGSLLLSGDCDTSLVGVQDIGASKTGVGGIALSCTTNTDVLRAGAAIQAIGSGTSISATESGLLLHRERDPPSFSAAVVLPFDLFLWDVASFVFGELAE